jgi:hypothetical protein
MSRYASGKIGGPLSIGFPEPLKIRPSISSDTGVFRTLKLQIKIKYDEQKFGTNMFQEILELRALNRNRLNRFPVRPISTSFLGKSLLPHQ